jgi:hypothetical protein
MAFESVSTPKVYPRYAETEAGTVIAEGLFNKEGQDKYGGPSWHIKSKDKHFVLNSSGHLNYQMRENVSVGDFIRVTYLGTEVMSSGRFAGEESHQFMIERDPDRSITPPNAEPSVVMSGGRFAGEESRQFMIERDPDWSVTPSNAEPSEVMSGGRFAGEESHQFMIERDPDWSVTPSNAEPSVDKEAEQVESKNPVSEEKAGSNFYSDLVF